MDLKIFLMNEREWERSDLFSWSPGSSAEDSNEKNTWEIFVLWNVPNPSITRIKSDTMSSALHTLISIWTSELEISLFAYLSPFWYLNRLVNTRSSYVVNNGHI